MLACRHFGPSSGLAEHPSSSLPLCQPELPPIDMKTVSFLRSWRKRASSKTSKEDDTHLPLQYPISPPLTHVPSPARYSPGPSTPFKQPLLSLTSSAFKEDFSHSVEEALQYRRGPGQTMPTHQTATAQVSYRENDSSTRTYHPNSSMTTFNGSPPTHARASPSNAKHFSSSTTPLRPQPVSSSFSTPGTHDNNFSSTRLLQHPSEILSPTHVTFLSSADIKRASTPKPSTSSSIHGPNTHGSPLITRHTTGPDSATPTRGNGPSYETTKTSHRRASVTTKEEHPYRTPTAYNVASESNTADPVVPHARRYLTSTRSTPHLRPETQYPHNCDNPLPPLPVNAVPSPSDPNFASFFPIPPPLIIRKKRPQPLVLNPQKGPLPFPPSPSPGYSSADSTPVATPQSTKSHFTTNASSPLKPPLGRKASIIPPPIHSPPTSPLPSPPSVPSPPRQSTHSFRAPQPLKSSRSAINLRTSGVPPSTATHRMTSSDPISEVAGQPTKDRTSSPLKLDSSNRNAIRNSPRRTDRRDTVAAPQDASVQWGYAL
ncbi:hypothetical protein D9611_002182 [Ephemerocybe angulata]|uniref:Uncharacterized protein n=1 Tax=Ephemerocybe angulata TaxID=980116 RepID=A0A8H5C188_9AGAR|nr:hypothetical protein D9611_002182 [Tulosesus angulatus]